MELIGIIGLIVSVISAGYGAYTSAETSKAAGKQADYDAQAEQDAANKAAEQEGLNRDTQRRAESRKLRQRRAIMEADFAGAGVAMTGTPEAVLSRQAAEDETYKQNMERISTAKGLGFDVDAQRAALRGRMESASHRYAAKTSIIGGAASTAGTGMMGWANLQANKKQSSWTNK